MKLHKIVEAIDEILKPSEFDDYCHNGIQIEGKEEVKRIITGVSCSQRFFNEAIANDADMILVHHGLFWMNDPRPFTITGIMKDRISLLIRHNISLVGYHLPLDANPELGNNAIISDRLSLDKQEFMNGGLLSRTKNDVDIHEFKHIVDENLATSSLVFPFGSKSVSNVFVVSGAGAFMYQDALSLNADTFITGEVKESHVRIFEEEGLNLIVAGHYNTEKYGVEALGEQLSKQFDLFTKFIDIPNPI